MTAEEFYAELVEAVSLSTDRAVIRVAAEMAPAGGTGSKVLPPTYPARGDEPPYELEKRVRNGEQQGTVLLDSVPSQANRVEEALLRARGEGRVALPLLELQHRGQAEVTLSSLEWPHRYADAYLRDSILDGKAFDRTQLGQSLQASTSKDATALYAHDPGSLVFGAWNSHRKGQQQRFPRLYSSEIVGWDPVVGTRKAGRKDPLNLVGAARRTDSEGWEYAPAGVKVKGEKLSEIGHGHVAPNPAHGGVTISSASRMATLSLAALDRLGFGTVAVEAARAGRAVLAAFALLGDRLAFGGPSVWLRSGCELVVVEERLEWVLRGGGTETFELTPAAAVELFGLAQERAAAAGLGMSLETVVLTPSPALAKAIDFTLTKAAPEGEALDAGV